MVEDIYYPTGGPLRGSVYRGRHSTALQEGSIQRLEEGRKSPRRRRTGNERAGKVERGTEWRQCNVTTAQEGRFFMGRGEIPPTMNYEGRETWRLRLVLHKSQGGKGHWWPSHPSFSPWRTSSSDWQITQHMVTCHGALWHCWDYIQLLSAIQLCIWTSTMLLATLNGSTLPMKEIELLSPGFLASNTT